MTRDELGGMLDPDPRYVPELPADAYERLVLRHRRPVGRHVSRPRFHARHLVFAAALAFILGGLIVHAVHASRSSATVIPASAFREVGHPQESRNPWPTTRTHVIVEPVPSRSSEPRPAVEQPVPEPVTRPVVVAPKAGVRGEASWYDDPRKAGLYAAAGPALRVGDWRGRTVTVCASTCFALVLSDFCGCPGGRVIDLSSTAFRRLASLGRGVISVTVTW